MSTSPTVPELDPIVVPIPEEFETTMDEWLGERRGDEPRVLPTSTAEMLAQARAESG